MLRAACLLAVLAAPLAAQEEPPLRASHPRAQSQRVGLPGTAVGGVTGRYTWSGQVSRILQARCQTCHHDGDIAPFPLMTYEDAYEKREPIRLETSARRMPPWHVESACARFADDPSLSEAEVQTLSRWVDVGAPEGDPRQAPEPLSFAGGWALGAPDLALAMPEPYTPDFGKGDVYRCFVLPTSLGEDRWVSAVELLPGQRPMVHHALLFVDTGTSGETLDAAEPGPGYTCFGGPGFTPQGALGGWAPGNRPAPLPDGVGILLPKGSKVVLQIHYNSRAGVVAPDATTVGIHFAKSDVTKRLYSVPLANTTFRIPPGAADYPVTMSVPFVPVDLHLLAVTPHMHLLGRTMKVEATAPDGTQTCLVDVGDWDFHWQFTYRYRDPVLVKAGSRIDLLATYDNSETNPENPNSPPREVAWGESTTDEMCIAFLSFTLE